ncbi:MULTISPECIES: plastocyanin/azurin family copper-binding protein [unclassified Mesorhizobium]|uniref:plastocyanin/azurin family copper-binding protein n=1 Tax=unclassified Mesorhizobium TaxID=325217 RepID=UPI0006FA68C6|nr:MULTISPECIES: plastocyanin/azurin family copper-binding protein [unclassified Mesorhizobium]KQZ12819.1 copper resistance protein [Mesorhizobium sp. Root1471]KQZ35339.1 copper resistance protein [Mesorhizobium sp. Root554]
MAASALMVGLGVLASPVFAATVINVVEDGEGGGAMSLKLDQQTVAAGPAVFKVKNDAATEEHEMILVRLTNADEAIPLNKARHRVDEKKLRSLGEVSDLKPGASGEMKATLKAGNYLVFCNIKGHYEAGMQAQLKVQ